MSGTIYICEPGGVATSYSEEHARALWNQGGISPQAHYWQDGMVDWRPAEEFFQIREPSPPPRAHAAMNIGGLFAKDPTTLTNFLKIMLWVSFANAIVGAVLETISIATGNASKAEPDSLSVQDIVQLAVGLFTIVIFIATGIPFLLWIHRANRNARALGAQGLRSEERRVGKEC